MDDQRTALRHRTLKTGTIAFEHGGGIDCLVRNLSQSGACLEIESPLGIPNSFTLGFKDGQRRQCLVAWRSARRIGVTFAR